VIFSVSHPDFHVSHPNFTVSYPSFYVSYPEFICELSLKMWAIPVFCELSRLLCGLSRFHVSYPVKEGL